MTGMLEKSLRTMASATSSRILKPLQQSTTKLLMLGESSNARNGGSSTSKGIAGAAPLAKAASRFSFGQDIQAVLSYESPQEMLDSMVLDPGNVGMPRLGSPARGRASQVDYMMPKPFDTGRSPTASQLKPNTSRGASEENRYL